MTALLQSVRIAPPASQVWSLANLKKHLEVEHDEDDALIEGFGETAAEMLGGLDTIYQRAWLQSGWRDFWPDFSRGPVLRLAPVELIQRITYINTAGTEMLINPLAYYLVPDVMGGRVCWSDAYAVPGDCARRPDAVRIDYLAGYGSQTEDAPARVRQAVRMLVGHWYRHREDVVIAAGAPKEMPKAVDALMAPFRRFGVEAWDSVDVPALGGGGNLSAVLGPAVTPE